MSEKEYGLVAQNRRARFDYEISETIEAGLVLTGSEVKSLRQGRARIAESYARPDGKQIVLVNAEIRPYPQAGRFNHEPKRPRLLLLSRREIARLRGQVTQAGATLVPLRLYFNRRGIAKLLLGVAKGRSKVDKREQQKKRDWERQKAALLRRHS